jgi:hypothetical protein
MARLGKWTADEDKKLNDAVQTHSGKNWGAIAEVFPGRTQTQCRSRWKYVLKPNIDRASGPTGKSVNILGLLFIILCSRFFSLLFSKVVKHYNPPTSLPPQGSEYEVVYDSRIVQHVEGSMRAHRRVAAPRSPTPSERESHKDFTVTPCRDNMPTRFLPHRSIRDSRRKFNRTDDGVSQ